MPSQMKKSAQRGDSQAAMRPQPRSGNPLYRGSGKLRGKTALITGADSGIGRSVAQHFAREGADVAVCYLAHPRDAERTCHLVESEGRRCLTLAGDVGDPDDCERLVRQTVKAFGRLDILVNNAGEQHPRQEPEEISTLQWDRTFRTNIFSCFYMSKAALKHMGPGCSIINTTSVTAFRGTEGMLDYASTKGAIVAFTRSLSKMLARRQIRVNAVAPGAVWTPLVASTFKGRRLKDFGSQNPMGRPGQPEEIAPSYVFLASQDASFMSGQVLHPNGGEIVNA